MPVVATSYRIKREHNLLVYGHAYGFGPSVAILSPWAEGGDLAAVLKREGAALTLFRRFQTVCSPLHSRRPLTDGKLDLEIS